MAIDEDEGTLLLGGWTSKMTPSSIGLSVERKKVMD